MKLPPAGLGGTRGRGGGGARYRRCCAYPVGNRLMYLALHLARVWGPAESVLRNCWVKAVLVEPRLEVVLLLILVLAFGAL